MKTRNEKILIFLGVYQFVSSFWTLLNFILSFSEDSPRTVFLASPIILLGVGSGVYLTIFQTKKSKLLTMISLSFQVIQFQLGKFSYIYLSGLFFSIKVYKDFDWTWGWYAATFWFQNNLNGEVSFVTINLFALALILLIKFIHLKENTDSQ